VVHMFDRVGCMSTGVVAAIDEAINSLDAVDVDTLDDAALHSLTVATQRLRDRFEVAAGRVLARWDTRGVWRSDQSLSAPARLSRETNSSMRGCRARLRRARRLGDVPAVVDAVARGELSVEHVELLGRAQRVAPDRYATDEAMLVDQCSTLRFPQAAQVVAYWRLHVDPDGADTDAARDVERATAQVSETFDGAVIVDATLTGVGAETFHHELCRLTDRIRHSAPPPGSYVPLRSGAPPHWWRWPPAPPPPPPVPDDPAPCSACWSATTRCGTCVRPRPGGSCHPPS
jgi:hypothetical protein